MLQMDEICIRPVEEEDLDTLYNWNTQEIRGDYQECQFESRKKIQQDFEEDGFSSERFQMLMVEKEDQPIGLIYLNFYREGLIMLGLVLTPNNCRQGIGTKVFAFITEYLFENYPIVRIEADTDIRNKGAQSILERAGFQQEGLLRKYRYHHGSYHDSYLYSKIKSELF
ncbi:MAG: GNAT family protein [Lachnospiraceae bacterium]